MKRNNFILPVTAFALLLSFGLMACNGGNQGGENSGSQQQNSSSTVQEKIKITAVDGKTKLIKGESVQLNADQDGVKWESDHPEIASVSDSGLVQGLAAGSAKITAKKDGFTEGSISIKVELEKITITAANDKTTLVMEEKVQLTASKDGVAWKSSDEAVATVNASSGEVTAVRPGSATITAEKEGFTAGTISITVTRPAATATLHFEDADHYAADGWWGTSADGVTPVYARSSGNASGSQCIAHFGTGDKETLAFTSTASTKAELVITMASSSEIADMSAVMDVTFNKAAVAISGKGFQGGSSSEFAEFSLGELDLEKGENRLEIAFKEASAYPYLDDLVFYAKTSVTIEVKAAPEKETITVEKAELAADIGGTVQINVTKPTDLTGILFSSDKESVATVDENGLVTGVALGSANITIRKEGMYSARIKVSVSEPMQEGEIRVEAEQADEIVSGDTNFMNLTDGAYTQIDRAHSGGGYITGYRVAEGDTLTMHFTSLKDQVMTLSVIASPAYQAPGPYTFATDCTITLNEDTLTVSEEAQISAGTGAMGQPTEETVLCDVNVKNGENTLIITFKGTAPSFDFFRLVPKA